MRITEVSRYLNRSPLEIEELLDATKEGADALVAITNEFNELLYDEIIPRMFRQLHHPLDQGRSLKFGERHFSLINQQLAVRGSSLQFADILCL